MKRILIAALACTLTLSASAAQAPVKPELGLPATGLTINDCLLILNGLNALDERKVILRQGKPDEAVERVPFEFAKGGLRLDISHNIAVLSAIQREAQPAQQKIFYEVLRSVPEKSPGVPATEIAPGTPAGAEYDRQMKELAARPCSAQLTRINAGDLNLDKNQIPVGVLALLDKVLDR